MSVVVALTMVAPARLLPFFTDWPLVGDTIIRLALDDGRGPAATDADGPTGTAVVAPGAVAAGDTGAHAESGAGTPSTSRERG